MFLNEAWLLNSASNEAQENRLFSGRKARGLNDHDNRAFIFLKRKKKGRKCLKKVFRISGWASTACWSSPFYPHTPSISGRRACVRCEDTSPAVSLCSERQRDWWQGYGGKIDVVGCCGWMNSGFMCRVAMWYFGFEKLAQRGWMDVSCRVKVMWWKGNVSYQFKYCKCKWRWSWSVFVVRENVNNLVKSNSIC